MPKKLFLLLPLLLALIGCFEKEIRCDINGLTIDNSIVGLTREQVIAKLGQPRMSDLNIKGFDDYRYSMDNKTFAVILHYEKRENQYYVSVNPKCTKADATLEISNHVVWH